MSKGQGFELRKSIRLPVSLPIKFKLFDIATRKAHPVNVYGQTRNISKEGLCLETNTTSLDHREIFLGCLRGEKQLQLELELPNVSSPLQLLGKVSWYGGALPGSSYQFSAGVFIVEATKEDLTCWQKFVEEYKSKTLKKTWWHKTWYKVFPKNK